jgi:hypothetical protein
MFLFETQYGQAVSLSLTDDAKAAELVASAGLAQSHVHVTASMTAADLRGLAAEALAMADEIDTATIAAEVAAADTAEDAAELADPERFCRTCGMHHTAREAEAAAQLGRCPRWAPEPDPADQPGSSADDYRHVGAWGGFMGSTVGYIVGQQREAYRDGAPVDAIYLSSDTRQGRRWVTVREVTNPAALAYLAEAVK